MSDALEGLTPEQYVKVFPMMRGLSGDAGRKVDLEQLLRISQAMNEGEAVEEDSSIPPVLFTVYEARKIVDKKCVDRWGIRHYKGNWHPQTFDTEEEATKVCDQLTEQWKRGEETILVHGFSNCQ